MIEVNSEVLSVFVLYVSGESFLYLKYGYTLSLSCFWCLNTV